MRRTTSKQLKWQSSAGFLAALLATAGAVAAARSRGGSAHTSYSPGSGVLIVDRNVVRSAAKSRRREKEYQEDRCVRAGDARDHTHTSRRF